MIGYVNSIQSLATVDGPGVRFAVFMQGCNLRCSCCHNPDTWEINKGNEYTADEIINKAIRFKEYFGEKGGITLSGGEPLLQAEFAKEVFVLAKENGINTCLDTSGSIINDKVDKLLEATDRVLLDIKYTDDESYLKYVGCSINKPLEFLSLLDKKGIPTVLRQVIIPELNGNTDNMFRLKQIADSHKCVEKVELLPFKKLCQVKYDKLGIEFPFKEFSEPSAEQIKRLEKDIR